MEKKKEIETLRTLAAEDTYFGQFFKKDIEQMCNNIERDYPIEFDTKFNMRAQYLEAELSQERARVREAKEDVIALFIRDNEAAFTKKFYEDCVNLVGRLFIIQAKRTANIPLSADEIDWLIKEARING